MANKNARKAAKRKEYETWRNTRNNVNKMSYKTLTKISKEDNLMGILARSRKRKIEQKAYQDTLRLKML